MIITAPWWFFLGMLSVKLGLGPGDISPKNLDLIFTVEMAISGLINAFILYLLGLLLTTGFKYLSSRKSKF